MSVLFINFLGSSLANFVFNIQFVGVGWLGLYIIGLVEVCWFVFWFGWGQFVFVFRGFWRFLLFLLGRVGVVYWLLGWLGRGGFVCHGFILLCFLTGLDVEQKLRVMAGYFRMARGIQKEAKEEDL